MPFFSIPSFRKKVIRKSPNLQERDAIAAVATMANQPPFPPSPFSEIMGSMVNRSMERDELAAFFAGTYVPRARELGFDQSLTPKLEGTTRLVSYNVHMMMGYTRDVPGGGDLILRTIGGLDADVLCVQEGHPSSLHFHGRLQYTYGFGKQIDWTQQRIQGPAFFGRGPLGNVIMSKQPMLNEKTMRYTWEGGEHDRARIHVDFPLPSGKGSLHVISTHFDVWDESGATRMTEAKQLHAAAMANGNPNTIIVGDFNAPHRPDYSAEHWEWMEKQNAARGITVSVDSTTMAYLIKECGWRDLVRESVGGGEAPCVSVWTMRRVDFALVHPDWNLPLPNAFFVYSAASDHLPLVVDLNLNSSTDTDMDIKTN